MEILWLLTRAWNTGILLYCLAQYPAAERWCGLAMRFLCHLGSLQDSYQTQVPPQGEGTGGQGRGETGAGKREGGSNINWGRKWR